MDEDRQADIERWLAPYLEALGNRTRRQMCPAYIAGLIRYGDSKSIQPIAARSDAIHYGRLHHFIGAGLWNSAPLETTWKVRKTARSERRSVIQERNFDRGWGACGRLVSLT